MFALNFAPHGFLPCDGLTVPLQSYQSLFQVIGKVFGGNGTTNFRLPNLQGVAPMHWGSAPDLSPRNLGDSGGETTVLLTPSTMAAHNHSPAASLSSTAQQPAGLMFSTRGDVRPAPNFYASKMVNPLPMNAGALANSGGGLPHNNLMPYQVLTFCICTAGDTSASDE